MNYGKLSAWMLATVMLCVGQADADDAPAKPAATAEANPADIQQWVKDLDSNSFTARQSAGKKLQDAGPAAVDAVAKAAASDSLEVTRQALDILRRFHESSDKSLREQADAALKKLEAGDNKSAASRAAEILKKPEQNAATTPRAVPIAGNIQVARAIRVQAGGGNNQKNIEVDENGVKVKIEEDNNGIKVTKTETVNGVEKTDKYEAKDLDDLKKNHPEGAKLYDKYAANQGNIILNGAGGAIQIQVQGGAGGFVPVPIKNGRIQVGGANQNPAKISALEKTLDELKASLRSTNLPKEQLEKIIEQVEAAKKQVEDLK